MTVSMANPRRMRVILAATLFGLTALVYGPVRHFEFLNYDDNVYVTENPRVKDGLSWSGLLWALGAFENGNWHPVTLLSHMLDVELFGLDPGGHHLVNVLLHAANAAVLFWLLSAATGRDVRSALVGALFAVHPLNVQSVAWISERKNLLSTFFWLLALGAYGTYRAKPAWTRYLLLLTFATLALASKPMAVTLPLTLMLLDYWPLGKATRPDRPRPRWTRSLLEKAPLFLLAGACGLLALTAQHAERALQPLGSYGLMERLGNAVAAYGWYLAKLVWPADLAAFYPHPMSTLEISRVVLSGAALAAVTGIVLACRKCAPYAAAGWGWYLVTLLPVIGLVQVGSQAFADRYAYVPLIGGFVMIVWAAAEWTAARTGTGAKAGAAARYALATLATCWVAALALGARHQLGSWRSSIALFERATRVVRDNAVAHNNLGMALVEKNRFDEALPHFQRAVEIAPWDAEAQSNLGNVLNMRGRPAEARPHYEMALRYRPDDAGFHYNLGKLLAETGEADGAITHFNEAVRLDPGHYRAHLFLGMVLYRQGRLEEAERMLGRAITIDATDAEGHYVLGLVLAAQGRRREALDQFREVLRVYPGDRRAQASIERLEPRQPNR